MSRAARTRALSRYCTMPSSISAPMVVWVFMISNSSGVNLPGLFKMLSGMDSFPRSCSVEAAAMVLRSLEVMW